MVDKSLWTEDDFIKEMKDAEAAGPYADKNKRPDWWPEDYGHFDDVVGRWVEPDLDGDGEEDELLPPADPATAEWERANEGVTSEKPDGHEEDWVDIEKDLEPADPATAEWEERMKGVTSDVPES